MFGDGVILWQVTLGLNLFRRETSDLISFLFHAEAYNFLAAENQIYLPPYGKWSSSKIQFASVPPPATISNECHIFVQS